MAEVFISRRVFPEAIDMLEQAGHQVQIHDSGSILPYEKLKEKVADKDGLICLLNDRVDAELLDSNPDLRVVSNLAVGYDNIDVEAATERAVAVTNTPEVLTETTADLTFALLMSAARRTPEADRYCRAGRYEGWELMQPQMGVDVHGKTLGIVGMGRIGSAVARRAHHGFDMEIIYHDRERKEELERDLAAKYQEFADLLEESDFVSIHTPLVPETEGMFSTEQFRKMKEDAILVNVARGPIVDEAALAQALKEGLIRGAALDVFEEEPKVHPKLAEREEFVALAPHLGSASRETRLKMARMGAENMIAGLAGKRPPNVLNPEVL